MKKRRDEKKNRGNLCSDFYKVLHSFIRHKENKVERENVYYCCYN